MSNAQSETPAGPYLVLHGGVLDGEVFPLKEGASLIIGSGRLANIQIASGDVSSAHLKITWDDSGLYLTDNASFTGTFVNDEQVETAVLWEGDVIGFAPRKDKPNLSTLSVHVPPGSVVVTAPPPEPEPPAPKLTESRKAAPPPPARKPASVTRTSGNSGRSGRRRGGGFAVDPKILTIAGGALGVLLLVWLGTCVFRGRSPVLSGIDPPLIEPGQNLTLTGLRFSENAQDNKVRFGETEGKVVSASTESLTVTVPEVSGVRAGQEIPVTVDVGGRRSGAVQLRIRLTPKVVSLIPDVALPGETVTARGQGLDAAGLSVSVEDRPAILLEARNDSARFRVPDIPLEPSRSATVVFKAEERAGKPMTLMIGRLPLLVGVEPNRVDVGDRLTLRGRGFSPVPSENRVNIGGAIALVVGARADALEVVVPDVGGGASASVAVSVAGRTTAPFSFTVSGPSTQWFRLRFFGAVVDGSPDRAAIATALGPLLLLEAKDKAASVAERAFAAAASLNEVAESMRGGKAVILEARSLPEPSIGIVGMPEALLRVLPDDLAAYEAPPDLARSARPTAQQLADHWTALLNDYLGALVAGHRPFRLCTVTPRAGALVQALMEMGWKPGGGVEPARAYSFGSETGRRLRELALLPAKPGQAIPGLAVEGRWEGEATEAGATKTARLQFRVTGGRLTGSLVLGSGVAMEIPIRDAAVQGGTLVFSYRQARSTPVWVATVGADSLTGEIHEGSASGPAGGQFTLRFAP